MVSVASLCYWGLLTGKQATNSCVAGHHCQGVRAIRRRAPRGRARRLSPVYVLSHVPVPVMSLTDVACSSWGSLGGQGPSTQMTHVPPPVTGPASFPGAPAVCRVGLGLAGRTCHLVTPGPGRESQPSALMAHVGMRTPVRSGFSSPSWHQTSGTVSCVSEGRGCPSGPPGARVARPHPLPRGSALLVPHEVAE